MKKVLVASLMMTLLVAGACKKDEKAAATATTTTTAATSQTKASDRTVLTINGEKVSESLFRSAAAGLPRQMQQAADTPEGKKGLADEIVRIKLLEQEGRRIGVADDAEVKNTLTLTATNIIASATLRKMVDTQLSDADLRQAYEKDKGKFDVIRARQIIVAYKGGQLRPAKGEAKSEGEAMARAQAIADRIRKGESFAAIARKESDDASAAETGGTIRFVRGSAPPPLEQQLVNLKPNGVTAPVKTPLAIHIMQLVDREARTFDQVKQVLAQQIQEEKVDKVLEGLKTKAKVEYDDSYFGDAVKPTVQ